MARRQGLRHPGDVDKQAEPVGQKAAVRVPRRKRRKPTGTAPAQRRQGPPKQSQHEDPRQDGHPHQDAEPSVLRLSRAPRPAERPPANPDVFSYTFTIWKST